jgi:sulfur carrier protein
VIVHVNGRPVELAGGATVQTAVEGLDVDPRRPGIAVAVDAEVVPRGEWGRRRLSDGDRVEVLAAIQGG